MTTTSRLRSVRDRLGPSGPIFLSRGIGLAAAVATVLVTSRVLGPESRGLVAAFAILQLIAGVALGLGTGSAAYVLSSRDGEPVAGLRGALARWTAIVFGGTLLLGGAGVVVGVIDRWIGTTSTLLLIVLAAGAAGQYASIAWTQLATGLGRVRATALGYVAPPVLVAGCSLAAALLQPTPEAFMLAQAAGWIVAASLLVVVVGAGPAGASIGVRRLLQRGRGAAVGDIANALSYRLDALLLGLIAGAGAVGVYSLAVQVLEPLWILAAAGASGLLIRLRGQADAERSAIATRTAWVVGGLTAAGVVVVLALVPVVIEIVGPGFAETLPAAIALAPGIVFLSVSKVLAAYQTAAGRLWLSSVVATASLVATTALDLLLIPQFGAPGASVASTLGYALSVGLWLVAFRNYSRAAGGLGGRAGTPGTP